MPVRLRLEPNKRLDGSGYPAGGAHPRRRRRRRGVASHRPYRAALPLKDALAEIEAGAGTCYDAGVCAVAVRLFREQGFMFTE